MEGLKGRCAMLLHPHVTQNSALPLLQQALAMDSDRSDTPPPVRDPLLPVCAVSQDRLTLSMTATLLLSEEVGASGGADAIDRMFLIQLTITFSHATNRACASLLGSFAQ